MSNRNDQFEDESKYDVGHVYDGIHELDHPAPTWWQYIFYASIVWGAGYYAYYEMLSGPTLKGDLQAELVQIEAKRLQEGKQGPTEDSFKAVFADSARVAKGKASYQTKCASCHGPDGQGGIGPNLTDGYWIHGDGSFTEIHKVVDQGVGDKGMPAWGSLMGKDEMLEVVAFVKSVQGTTPSNPKAPQGEKKQ